MRYTDPTGHYVETLADIAFIGMDLNNIRNDPTNPWNYAALGGDIIGAAVPFGTGFGLGIKTIEHGGDASKAITSYTKAQNAGKTAQDVIKQNGLNVPKNKASQGGQQKQNNSPLVQLKGTELKIGNNLRIAPIGNPTAKKADGSPNWSAILPHIHYAKKDVKGNSLPGQGASRHRPWETLFKKWFKK